MTDSGTSVPIFTSNLKMEPVGSSTPRDSNIPENTV
jgi:hypothetical protein